MSSEHTGPCTGPVPAQGTPHSSSQLLLGDSPVTPPPQKEEGAVDQGGPWSSIKWCNARRLDQDANKFSTFEQVREKPQTQGNCPRNGPLWPSSSGTVTGVPNRVGPSVPSGERHQWGSLQPAGRTYIGDRKAGVRPLRVDRKELCRERGLHPGAGCSGVQQGHLESAASRQ